MDPAAAIGLIAGTIQIFQTANKIYAAAGATSGLDRRSRELLTTIDLAQTSLSLLETQRRLLTAGPALAEIANHNATTYDDGTTRATIAMTIAMKERLKRAMTAIMNSVPEDGQKRPTFQVRAPFTKDMQDHRNALHELLQDELIPLVRRHEYLLSIRYGGDEGLAHTTPSPSTEPPPYSEIIATQSLPLSLQQKQPQLSDTETPSHQQSIQMKESSSNDTDPTNSRAQSRSPRGHSLAEADMSSSSDDDGDSDKLSLAGDSLEAINLGIPELAFHRDKVVKRVTIFGRKNNFSYSCNALLDTGAFTNIISKSLKRQIAGKCGFRNRRSRPRRRIQLGDGSWKKVKNCMEIDWGFEADPRGPRAVESSRYTHGFFSLEDQGGAPFEMIIGQHIIFEYKLLCENLEILPLGLPEKDAEATALCIFGLGKQDKVTASADLERARIRREENERQRAASRQADAARAGPSISASNTSTGSLTQTQSISSTGAGSSTSGK